MTTWTVVKLIQIFLGFAFALTVILAYNLPTCMIPLFVAAFSFFIAFCVTLYFNHLRTTQIIQLERLFLEDRECCWLFNWLVEQYKKGFDDNKITRKEFITSLKDKLRIIHKQRGCGLKTKDIDEKKH